MSDTSSEDSAPRHKLSRGQLYRWRVKARLRADEFGGEGSDSDPDIDEPQHDSDSNTSAELEGQQVDLPVNIEADLDNIHSPLSEGNETAHTDNDSGEEEIFMGNSGSYSSSSDHLEDNFETSSPVISDHPDSRGPQSHSSRESSVLNEDQESNVDSDSAQNNSLSSDEADSDRSEEEIFNNDGDQLLFPGAPLTVRESMLAILSLSVSERLSKECLDKVLSLVSLHCPQPNLCRKTIFKFQKFFSIDNNGMSQIKRHYYCTNCKSALENETSVCDYCVNGQSVSFFIEMPIKSQLQTMFKRPGFYDDLQFRFNREKSSLDNIEEVYDGRLYKEFFENGGFLSNPNHISLMAYSDGISIYNSSNKYQIWPLDLVINELRYKQRSKQENIILAGIWFGPSKPVTNLFLKPFHDELQRFKNDGYLIQVPGNRQGIKICGMLLSAVFDLPAKSCFMRFIQFNGYYGCHVCKSPGLRHHITANSSVQVYPYSRDMTLRTNEEVAEYADEAFRASQRDPDASVFGVKGPSLLYAMMPNMIRGVAIDVFHSVFIGIWKLILSFHFDSSFHNSEFSISALVDVVDDILKNIKPPSTSQRYPRSIKKELSHWKGSEYKMFMMYYCIPVLLGLLDDKYLKHHCLLISAIFLLSQESISENQRVHASQLLHTYVSQFQLYYGLRYMGMNVHLLLHLPLVVLDLGPLWAFSCFFLEDLNGKFARLVHGTRHAAMQICSTATITMGLPSMIDSLDHNRAAYKFCSQLSHSLMTALKVAEEIAPGIFALGKLEYPNHVPLYISDAIRNSSINLVGGKYATFNRLCKRGSIYSSESYTRPSKKESRFVSFSEDNDLHLGKLNVFFKWSPCRAECNSPCNVCPARYYCVATIYEAIPWFIHNVPNARLSYLSRVVRTENVVAFPIDMLKSVCFYFKVNGNEYMATPINRLEIE